MKVNWIKYYNFNDKEELIEFASLLPAIRTSYYVRAKIKYTDFQHSIYIAYYARPLKFIFIDQEANIITLTDVTHWAEIEYPEPPENNDAK